VSVPEVTFFVFDFVTFQKREKLLLKGSALMMFSLLGRKKGGKKGQVFLN
jgi:hypothetical protein